MKKTFLITASIVSLVGMVSYFFIGKSEIETKSKIERDTIVQNEIEVVENLFSSVDSQNFTIQNERDTIIETENGMTFFIPKNTFFDENGQKVKKVDFDVKELTKISEAINEQITNRTADGKLVKPEKTFSITAKDFNGNELTIDKNNPIQVEIPTKEKELSLFQGQKNEQNDLLWNPVAQAEKKYLQTIPFSDLDFLPKGFEKLAISKWGLSSFPTKKRIDSVYYSLDFFLTVEEELEEIIEEELEDEYDENDEIIRKGEEELFEANLSDSSDFVSEDNCKVINPISIQTIKSGKFANTFLATKEFEKRLQFIHKSRDNSVLEIYINNLDKPLWKVDQMVVKKLKSSDLAKYFQKFANQKLTNVKETPSSQKFADYYQKKKKQLEKDLKKTQRAYQKELKQASQKYKNDVSKVKKKIAKTRKKYEKLLVKRQNYRLKKYNSRIIEVGVYCLGIPLEKFELTLDVDNGEKFDRVHAYIINEEIQSLWAMTSLNKVNFRGGYPQDVHLIMRKNQKALALGIAYKGDSIFFIAKEFKQKPKTSIQLELVSTTLKELEDVIKTFDNYKEENKLSVEIDFQEKMYQQQKELERINENEKKRLEIEERKIQFFLELINFLCPEDVNYVQKTLIMSRRR